MYDKFLRIKIRAMGVFWTIGGVFGILTAVRRPEDRVTVLVLSILSIVAGIWFIRARNPLGLFQSDA